MPRAAQPILPFNGEPDDGPEESLGTELTPTLAGSSPRALGAYYTPPVAAQVLVSWALRGPSDRILEPSMGEGVFLRALDRESERRQLSPEVFGIEIAADTFEATVSSGAIVRSHGLQADFFAVNPFDVDAVVGNPPYVRLRHLPGGQSRRALAAAEQVLGEPMDPAGSVWMPFVLHATRFLRRGGRLALVLPYDLTYVRYARPLWKFLADNFGDLRVTRVHERMFPEILQETVLLLAGDFGEVTKSVGFEAYETVEQLAAAQPVISRQVSIEQVVRGDRAFLQALLTDDARELLNSRLQELTVPASSLVTFNIGYVCGDKTFFHPDTATIKEYSLPKSSLRPSLTSSRRLRGMGLKTSALASSARTSLFLPPADEGALTPGELRYVALGAKNGVSGRYKCRIRDPWYATPYVKVPDVLLPVFTERPALLVNDAGYVASNSLLCGYVKTTTPEALATAWFTSLTLLQLELQVHALGGGVMVVVPREAGAVRLPRARADVVHLGRLHDLLAHDRVEDAFASGDEVVLHGQVGLTAEEVGLIEDAAVTLARWRQAVRSSVAGRALREDVEEEQAAL
jgi:adenine-specific DNA-methyltransferase